MTISKTTLVDILQKYYSKDGIAELVFDKESRAALTRITKVEDFSGDTFEQPVLYGQGGGRSATFTTAQDNSGAPSMETWSVDVKQNNCVVKITTDMLQRARNNQHAFVQALRHALDTGFGALADDLAADVYAPVGYNGCRGQIIGSASTGTVLSLGLGTTSSSWLSVYFEKGDVLEFAKSDDPTGSILNAANFPTITAVDRVNGTITIGTDFADYTGSQYAWVGKAGDLPNGSTTNKKMSGLLEWLPTGSVTSTAFHGVDRTADSRLSGNSLTSSTSSVEDALYSAATAIAREGRGKPTVAFLHYDNFRDLVAELGADAAVHRKTAMDSNGKASTGYSSVSVFGPRGVIEVVADTFCPKNKLFVLDEDVVKIISMGALLQVDKSDGKTLKPIYNSSGYEIRLVSFSNLIVSAPSRCAVVSLS